MTTGPEIPEGYKAYPRLERALMKLPPDAVLMASLFSDESERKRASQALTLVTSQSLQCSLPFVFHKQMVNTPFWNILCEAVTDVAVRAFTIGVYLGQAGLAKIPEGKND